MCCSRGIALLRKAHRLHALACGVNVYWRHHGVNSVWNLGSTWGWAPRLLFLRIWPLQRSLADNSQPLLSGLREARTPPLIYSPCRSRTRRSAPPCITWWPSPRSRSKKRRWSPRILRTLVFRTMIVCWIRAVSSPCHQMRNSRLLRLDLVRGNLGLRTRTRTFSFLLPLWFLPSDSCCRLKQI